MRGHDWQAIRDSFPLSEVVAKVVKLKRQGSEWKACCPFHHEKTASFTIYSNDRRYHCFGCGKDGDVIDFVSEIDGVDTAQAVANLTGGKPPRYSEEDRAERERWLEQQRQQEERERKEGIAKARKRWDRAHPAEDTTHPYLEAKAIAPHMARIEGQNLLIPIWDADGEVMSVQAIPPEPGARKDFASKAPTRGGRLLIGIHMGRTIICEGFATGATIYDATVDQVCVAFSQDNIRTIAHEYHAAGVNIVIAADRKATDAMLAIGRDLDIPIIIPPELKKGDDFNDQAKEQSVEAVAATFRAQLLDFANRPPPPPHPPFCAVNFVEAFDFDEALIPERQWLIPGAILARNTHMLAAPGGTGKSLFTLQLAIMLATGQEWNDWEPKRPYNVLIINAEDDINEQRRRLAAARRQMGIDTGAIGKRIMIADSPDSILISANDPKSKAPVATPLVEQLVAVIRHYAIDIVIVDPFAETFDGDENSNGDTKWAMKTWRDDIARATGAAVYLVHHTTKNAGDKAGSTDVIRGASALVNSVRMAATLFVMTSAEAGALGISEEDRFQYVRYDDAKSNQSLVGGRRWFRKVTVRIGNGDPRDTDSGDDVGALEPWRPSPTVPMYAAETLMEALAAVNDGPVDEDGVIDDLPFGVSLRGGSKRWVGYMLMRRLGIEKDAAKDLIKRLTDDGVLQSYTLDDPSKGRMAGAARVDMVVAERTYLAPQNEL